MCYLVPPHVPDVRREEEVRRKKRVNNLFEGSRNLNDPLLKILKSASKNPYAKGAKCSKRFVSVTVEIPHLRTLIYVP